MFIRVKGPCFRAHREQAAAVMAPLYLQVGLKFPPSGSFHIEEPATAADESSRPSAPERSGAVRRSGAHTPAGLLPSDRRRRVWLCPLRAAGAPTEQATSSPASDCSSRNCGCLHPAAWLLGPGLCPLEAFYDTFSPLT